MAVKITSVRLQPNELKTFKEILKISILDMSVKIANLRLQASELKSPS